MACYLGSRAQARRHEAKQDRRSYQLLQPCQPTALVIVCTLLDLSMQLSGQIASMLMLQVEIPSNLKAQTGLALQLSQVDMYIWLATLLTLTPMLHLGYVHTLGEDPLTLGKKL